MKEKKIFVIIIFLVYFYTLKNYLFLGYNFPFLRGILILITVIVFILNLLTKNEDDLNVGITLLVLLMLFLFIWGSCLYFNLKF